MRELRTENRKQKTETETENGKQGTVLCSRFSVSVLRFCSLFLFSVLCYPPPVPVFGQDLPNQCLMPRPLPALICEEGGEFLCLNTPPGGVKENFVLLKGRLNLERSSLGSFSVSTQHEYTNEIQTLELADPIEENCWEQNLSAEQNFCLEEDGKFSVYISLDQLGPYTIQVAASPTEGTSIQKTARTSSVVPPTVTPEIVSYEPGATHIQVTLDLLKDCESRETCDFLGTTTGGVWVTVINQIDGETQVEVRCATNVPQGGAGLFIIGVPAMPGANQVQVSVCNAHTGFEKENCPKLGPRTFTVSGQPVAIEQASLTPTGSLSFRVSGFQQEECDETVQVAWNLETAQSLCPDPEGRYAINFNPKPGYNIASITVDLPNQRLEETVSFAHGEILSPFAANGSVLPEEEWRLHDAVQIALSKDFLNDVVAVAADSNFENLIQEWTETLGLGPRERVEDPDREAKEKVQAGLGYCPASGNLGDLRIKVMGEPKIGSLEIQPLQFENQKVRANLEAKDVSVAIQLYKDENDDGRPDIDPLPLKIAFKKVKMKPQLETASLPDFPLLLKLTSPYSDCDYKRRGACFGFPALLTPSQFEGAANRAGAFATCDHSQGVSEEMEEICHALNVVDRQTGGVIQEKILDALNKTYACDSTAALTVKAQEGISFTLDNDILPVEGRMGMESLKINPEGILASLFTQFGSRETFQGWPEELRHPETGILVSSGQRRIGAMPANLEGLRFDLDLAAVSQMFWQGFTLTIDEAFFEERGFDFAWKCDQSLHEGEEGWEEDPLCNLRPRAIEIFSTPISDYGYLEPDDPLTLTLTPSQAFPLHLKVLSGGEKLALELADWELGIASQEQSLITARLSLLLVVEVSPLEITSEDPDHFILTIKTIPEESKLWVTPKQGTNATVIPGSTLLSNLKEKLQLAIDNFSQEGKEIKIQIPRSKTLPEDSLFARLGLHEIVLGPDGFRLGWIPNQNRLQFFIENYHRVPGSARGGPASGWTLW